MASAIIVVVFLALSLWQCKFLVSKEPTTLLDVTMVDTLTTDHGYAGVVVEVLDTNGTVLKKAFDGPYNPANDGAVLHDIDLGPSPPGVLIIRITGTKSDSSVVVFTKKVTDDVAEKGWTQGKSPDKPDKPPDSSAYLSIQPRKLLVAVDSVANLDVVHRPGATDSLVWGSSEPSIALSLGNGKVKGVATGQATITVYSFRTPSIHDSAVVNVYKKVDSVASIRLDVHSLTLYTGGASRTLIATILPTNPDNLPQFSSQSDNIAKVDQKGVITGSSPGIALIVAYPAGHADIFDTCIVTVKTDKPIIDAGSARKVDLNASVSFPVKVRQEYGQVADLKWDLDGDGVWEGSIQNADTAQPVFTYASARPYKARFEARDTEGNTDSTSVTVQVGGNAPLVDITRPGRDTVVNTPKFRLEYSVNSSPRTRDIQLQYGTHKVGVSDTVAGEIGTDSVTITLDTLPPKVRITSPAPGTATRAGTIGVTWTIDSAQQQSLQSENIAGRQGSFKIGREATDAAGNRGFDSVTIVRDTIKPVVIISSPTEGQTVSTRIVAVKWKADGQDQTNGTSDTLAAGDGPKRIVRRYTDAADNQDTAMVNVILDEFKPGIPVLIDAGTTPSPTQKDTVAWNWGSGGNGNGIYRYSLDAGSVNTTQKATGNILSKAPGLPEGPHTLKVQEGDDQGNWSGYLVHSITVDRTPPKITLAGGDRTVTDDAFTVSATIQDSGSGIAGLVQLSGTATGILAAAGGKYSLPITLAAGLNTLTVTARDSAGNTGTATLKITYTPLPPFKVLIFNKALGFDHTAAKPAATKLIMSDLPTLLKASAQFTVDTTTDLAQLTLANLSTYDVLVLNSPSGLNLLSATNKAAVLDFMNAKGLIVIHGLIDASWPEFNAATGITNINHGNPITATLLNEAPTNWINTGLPATVSLYDEWWTFNPSPVADPAIVTLWSLDETSAVLGQSGGMGFHPMAWCKELSGGGRVFYTGQGHDLSNYVKTGMLGRLLYNALMWTAKRDK